jgi:hypothetical protein
VYRSWLGIQLGKHGHQRNGLHWTLSRKKDSKVIPRPFLVHYATESEIFKNFDIAVLRFCTWAIQAQRLVFEGGEVKMRF